MKKKKARIMFFRAVSLINSALLGVCIYQLSQLLQIIQQLNSKFDLFEVVDKLLK